MKLEWFGAVLNLSAIKAAVRGGIDPNVFAEDKQAEPLVPTQVEILEEKLSLLKAQRSNFISQSRISLVDSRDCEAQIIGLTNQIFQDERELESLREVQKKERNWKVSPLTKAIYSKDLQKISVAQSLLEAKADVNLMFIDNTPLFERTIEGDPHEEFKLNLKELLKLFEIWPKKEKYGQEIMYKLVYICSI